VFKTWLKRSLCALLATGTISAFTAQAQAAKIAYAGYASQNSNTNIHIMNDDGSGKQLVIDYSSVDWYPALSYDNTKIVFSGYKFRAGLQLFTVNIDGTNLTQITPDGGGFLAASWSPDGKQIVCMGGLPPSDPDAPYDDDIYIMNSDGSNLRVLADVAQDFLPSWSPDGKKIIFSSSATTSSPEPNVVYSVSPDGSNLQAITPPGNYYQLSWSSDSKKILYAYDHFDSQTGEQTDTGIAIMNADGSNPQIIHNSLDYYNFPRFMENGRIAFLSRAAGQQTQIFSMNAGGSDVQQLTNETYGVQGISTAFNIAPFSAPQTVTTNEDTTVNFVLTAEDSNGDSLEYSIVSGPSHGALSGIAPNLSYTPATNFHGDDSFTYRAGDGKTSTDITVSLKVKAVNDAPTATPQNLETSEDTALNIVLSGSDTDGSISKYLIDQRPQHGLLSGSGQNLIYTPFSNFNGQDSFTFYVGDGWGYSAPATVRIHVTPVNDAPVAVAGNISTLENTSVNIQLQASDPDGDALAYSVLTLPANGTLGGTGSQRTYSPKANFVGSDSFTFRVSDGVAQSSIVKFTINVDARVPIANNDNYTLDMRPKKPPSKLVVTRPGVLANDSDDDALSAIVSKKPAKGNLKLNRDGSFTFTPPNNKTATYSFSYSAFDGKITVRLPL
jgi:Tol biopolymer transport system component